eukprot:3598344-Alexandrium_andersonii.AAC.1
MAQVTQAVLQRTLAVLLSTPRHARSARPGRRSARRAGVCAPEVPANSYARPLACVRRRWPPA